MSDNSSAVSCYVCEKQFSTAGNFRRHLKTKHLQDVKEKLEFSGGNKEGDDKPKFSKSKQDNIQNHHTICHICNKTFVSASNFRRHLKNKHTQQNKSNIIIPKISNDEENSGIKDLKKLNVGERVKNICYICGTDFLSTQSMKKHLKSQHNLVECSKYRLKCMEPFCNFQCNRLDNLRHHLELKHELQQEVEE